ncbi:MAG: glycosyltransferase family 1 protein [Phormidesmis sp.]
MKSLLVNLSALMDRPTGISTYAQNLIPFFQKLDPTFLTALPLRDRNAMTIPPGLSPDFGRKGHLKRLLWLQNEMPKYYRQSNGGLIFSPLPEAPLYSDCRFVVTAHDTIPLRFSEFFPWHLVSYFRHYIRRVLAQAEHIICNSVTTARDIAHFYQIPERKITPILLAYDRQNFRPVAVEPGNYFLYLGRQDAHKNIPRLISAFDRVCQQNAEVELKLVGSQDKRYRPTLVAQADSLGIGDRVHFIDYVDYHQLPRLLSGAIALTLPSLWEGFGLPVIEAMACGTPVITSNLSSLPEVAGDAALLVDPYNIDELADAMRLVASDTQLRQTLQSAGLQRAQHFSWQKTGEQTAQVIGRFM